MVGVSDLGRFALVCSNDIAKDDGENDDKANNDESESGVLQTSTTVTSLGRGFPASRLWVQPNTVAGFAIYVVGVQRVGNGRLCACKH